MAGPIAFRTTGIRELRARLGYLDKKARRSIHAKVLRAGAARMRGGLKAGVPRDTGAARRAIVSKVRLKDSGRRGYAVTGERTKGRTRSKKTKAAVGGPHLHLAESGTQQRFWTGQKRAEKRLRQLRALQASPVYGLGRGNYAPAIQGAMSAIAIGKARSRVARAIAGGESVGARALTDLRKGKSTGRVRPRRFWNRIVLGAALRVHATQAAVLKQELEAAWRAG